MSNANLLKTTKLCQKVAKYVDQKTHGVDYDPSSEGCFVQITSTNPFEISDMDCHVRIKDYKAIEQAAKSINSNMSLASMSGLMLNVLKWGFKDNFDPDTNNLEFEIEIYDVIALSGSNTVEIPNKTIDIMKDDLVRKKLERLRKFYIAQKYTEQHSYEPSLFDEARKQVSDKIRKRADEVIRNYEPSGDLKDPMLLYRPDGNVSVSQLSQKSEPDYVSLNSAFQARYDSYLLNKQSQQKRYYQIAPAEDPFAYNFDNLSTDPLVGRNLNSQLENAEGTQTPTRPQNQNQKEDERYPLLDYDQDEGEEGTKQQGEKQGTDKAQQMVDEGDEPKQQQQQQQQQQEAPQEEEQQQQQFHQGVQKRNFDQMQNEVREYDDEDDSEPFPQARAKKIKDSWGLNHINQQQQIMGIREKRRNQENKRSHQGLDTLDLLAKSLSNENSQRQTQEYNPSAGFGGLLPGFGEDEEKEDPELVQIKRVQQGPFASSTTEQHQKQETHKQPKRASFDAPEPNSFQDKSFSFGDSDRKFAEFSDNKPVIKPKQGYKSQFKIIDSQSRQQALTSFMNNNKQRQQQQPEPQYKQTSNSAARNILGITKTETVVIQDNTNPKYMESFKLFHTENEKSKHPTRNDKHTVKRVQDVKQKASPEYIDLTDSQDKAWTPSQLQANTQYLETFADLKALKNRKPSPQPSPQKLYVNNPINQASQIDLDQFIMVDPHKNQSSSTRNEVVSDNNINNQQQQQEKQQNSSSKKPRVTKADVERWKRLYQKHGLP